MAALRAGLLLCLTLLEACGPCSALRNRTAEQLELKFFGRALSYDWHFRSHRIPPMRETILIQTTDGSAKEAGSSGSGDASVVMEFFAFRKIWTLRLTENTMLLSDASSFEQRSPAGTLLLKEKGPRGCFFIGAAEADETEYGYAAVTTCGDKLRGLVITNINDYVIFSSGWRSPLFGSATRKPPPAPPVQPQRKRRGSEQPAAGAIDGVMEVANLTEYDRHATALLKKAMSHRPRWLNRRQRRSSTRVEIGREPVLGPLLPPLGRVVHVELGTIMDKWYINDFREQVSAEPADLVIHAAELINNAQLWYIHPTLGFQVWLTLRSAIMINEDVGLKLDNTTHSYPAAMCKWVTETFPDEMAWDEVIMFSSKEGIWHGRSGLAQRSGVCAADGKDRCAGVSHVNFQMASLARLVAHEAMHPLGVSDDYDGLTSEMCFSGLMRRGVWQDHDWSVCSVHDLERWLEQSSSQCVARRSTPSVSSTTLAPVLPVNVAWRAKATQSSTYISERKWGAWKATDGGLSGVPPNGREEFGSCSHTREEDFPWLRVELDAEYRKNVIHKVILYNRDDCCSERLNNLEVRVGNFSDFTYNPVCAKYSKAVPGGRYGALVLECTRPLAGRFVSVHLLGKQQILTICEMQVLQMIRLKEFDNRIYSCQDHHGFCPFWAAIGECRSTSQKLFMDRTCPYSCGVCKRPSRLHHALATYTSDALAEATRGTTPAAACSDKYDSCMHSAANGDCFDSFEMEHKCPRSCGFCTDAADTEVDVKPTIIIEVGADAAVAAAEIGLTISRVAVPHITSPVPLNLSRKNYPSTQVSATPTEAGRQCRDHSASCQGWHRAGYCKTSSHARRLCEATCELCGAALSPASVARELPVHTKVATSTAAAAAGGGGAQCDRCGSSRTATAVPQVAVRTMQPARHTAPTTQTVVNTIAGVPPCTAHSAGHLTQGISQSTAGHTTRWPLYTRSGQLTGSTTASAGVSGRMQDAGSTRAAPVTGPLSELRRQASLPRGPASLPWTAPPYASSATHGGGTRRHLQLDQTTAAYRAGSCIDLSHACGSWKRQGYCVGSQSVRKACRESCDLC